MPGIENRPFTEHTRWIICMWHIRGFRKKTLRLIYAGR